MKKWMVLVCLMAAMSLLLAGCSGSNEKGGASTGQSRKVMKLGSPNMRDSSLNQGLVKFAEIINKESGGSIEVQVFPDGVLGGDRQTLEALQMNTVQGTTCSSGPLASFAPRMEVLDLPFLFKDKPTAYKVLDGPIGDELLNDLSKVGMVGLGWWSNGFRHVTNSKREIKQLEDINGLKIRTMESRIHVDLWKKLGANPTPIAITQLYTALEQKTVDGQENPFGVIKANKFEEIEKYLTKTGHVYSASPFLISQKFWDTLSEQEKALVKKAAKEATAYQRQLNDKEDKDVEAYFIAKGMKVTEMDPQEKERIFRHLESIYQDVSARVGGDLVTRLVSATRQ